MTLPDSFDRWAFLERLPAPIANAIVRRRYRGPVWQGIPEGAARTLVHIPKTGGTTFARVVYGREVNHYPAFVFAIADPERWRRQPPIAFLRDPAERMLSAIAHHFGSPRMSEADRRRARRLRRFGDDPETIATGILAGGSLPGWLRGTLLFRPQHRWIESRGARLVEDLRPISALDATLRELGFTPAVHNRTERRHDRPIDPSLRRRIEAAYPKDAELWNRVGTSEGSSASR